MGTDRRATDPVLLKILTLAEENNKTLTTLQITSAQQTEKLMTFQDRGCPQAAETAVALESKVNYDDLDKVVARIVKAESDLRTEVAAVKHRNRIIAYIATVSAALGAWVASFKLGGRP